MSILTRPVDELIRYILKRLHGGLLKNDLDINNFSSHISGGRFHLSNIELNPEAVNAMLPDSPVHLVSARVAQITVQTPSLTRFLEDPIIVEAQELEVDLCSALYSHSRVLRVPEVRLEVSESPDDSAESAMIFGKAIERIITNMKFSLLRTRIRLKAHPEDAQSVDLFLPEIWLKDTSVVGGPFKIKELKLKGLILFVTKDRPPSVLNPYDYSHICQMDEETAISIAVSKETIKVDIAVKRILLILAPSQAEIVFRILTALEKSRNEEQASEEVMEDLLQRTYLSLDEDVRRSLEIEPRKQKKASVKVVLSDFAVVGMMQEPIASESRKWQFQKPGEPYTYLNAPHLVLSASACAIDKTPIRCVFTVKALEIHHHDLVETVCLGSSSLFVSARESYSSEFFRTDSVRDEFWHLDPEIYHICSTPVLYFDVLREPVHSYLPDYDISLPKQNLKIVLSQETMSIKTGTLFMNLKEPLFRAMKTYLKLFPKPQKGVGKGQTKAFKVGLRIPLLRIMVQRIDSTPNDGILCCCKLKEIRPWCAVLDAFQISSEDADQPAAPGFVCNSKTAKVSLFLISEHELEELLSIFHLLISVNVSSMVTSEAYYCVTLTENRQLTGSKKEIYIPGQGATVLPEYFRASEPYDSSYHKSCPHAEEVLIDREEERKSFESGKTKIRISIPAVTIQLDHVSLQRLLDLIQVDPPSPAPHKDAEDGKWGLVLETDTVVFSLMERRQTGASQVHLSHLPQTQVLKSTIISTLDASAIRSRTVCNPSKSGKMIDRRFSCASLKLSAISLACFEDFYKPKQMYFRLGISRMSAFFTQAQGEADDNNVFAYSLRPQALPGCPNPETLSLVCTVDTYLTSISFITRLDPSQVLTRSKSDPSSIGSSKDINVTITFRGLVFRLDQLFPLVPKLAQFGKINMKKGRNSDLMKVKIQAKALYLDYDTEPIRCILEVDDFAFWTALVTNLESKGMHAAISSVQMYLLNYAKDKRPELALPVLDPKGRPSELLQDVLGFIRVLSLDSLELFFSQVINPMRQTEAEAVPDSSPPLLSCLLSGNACRPVSDSLFICDLAEIPLRHDILDVHLNLGCVMVFLCFDSLESLGKVIQSLEKEGKSVIARVKEERKDGDIFDETLASGGVTVHPCVSKSSKVNLMNLAEADAWGIPELPQSSKPPNSSSDLSSDSGQDFDEVEESDQIPESEDVQKSSDAVLFRLPHVIHSHISFPSIVKLQTVDSDFHQLKACHGFPVMRITASLTHISATIYQGADFEFEPPEPNENPRISRGVLYKETILKRRIRKDKRILSYSLKLKQESTGITFTKFPKKLHYAWRLSFTIRDFEVLDQIQISEVYKLLHYNKEFLRESFAHMLALDIASVWPSPELNDEEELRIMVNLLPLKINLDQYALNFIVDMLGNEKAGEQEMQSIKVAVRPPVLTSASNAVIRSSDNLRQAPVSPPKSVEGFVQSLRVTTVSLSLDYIPRKLLLEGVSSTSPANAINLFPIENMVLTLPEVYVKGQRSVKEAFVVVGSQWLAHIRAHEIFSILGGIGPLASVKNVVGAIVNLVRMPYISQNPLSGAKQGLITLATVVSVESLGLLGTALTSVHAVVNSLGRIAGLETALPTRQQVLRPILKAQYTVIPYLD